MGGSERLDQAKEMMARLNKHPGNLFQALYAEEEKKPKDLSEFHDNKPLVIGSAALLLYVTLGCILYTQVTEWSFIDALYFTIVTLTTVGYGDLLPSTNAEKIITIFFVFIGVGLIGAALGIVASTVLDKADALEDALDDKTKRLNAVQVNLIVSTLLIILMLAVGTLAFGMYEDLDFVTALYVSAVTVTTVGYGDFSFSTEEGRLFGVVYLVVGTVIIAKALSDIASIPLEARKARLERMVLEQYGSDLSLDEFEELTRTGAHPGFCTKNEFILLMLKKLNKISTKDIREAVAQFDALDADGSGVLTSADVEKQRVLATKLDEAKGNMAAAALVANTFDDALEGQSLNTPARLAAAKAKKRNQVVPASAPSPSPAPV